VTLLLVRAVLSSAEHDSTDLAAAGGTAHAPLLDSALPLDSLAYLRPIHGSALPLYFPSPNLLGLGLPTLPPLLTPST
jgi:hypothetical protein